MALCAEGANASHTVRARQACRGGRALTGRVRLRTPQLRTLHSKHRPGGRRNRRRAGQRHLPRKLSVRLASEGAATSAGQQFWHPGKGRRQLQQETHGDFRTRHAGLTSVFPVEIRPMAPQTGSEGLMTSTLRAFILGVILVVTTNSATRAADRSITLRLGAGSALEVERPFKTVLIGDPDIVEVHTKSDTQF